MKAMLKPPCQLRSRHRLPAVVVTMVVTVVLLGIGPALAQAPPRASSIDVPLSTVLDGTGCGVDSVILSGTIHLIVEDLVAVDGSSRTGVVVDLRAVNAKGQTTDRAYRLENQDRNRREYPCRPGDPCLDSVPAPFTLMGGGQPIPGRLLLNFVVDPRATTAARVTASKLDCEH